jgi:Na+/H+ antiporter NhaC
VFEYSKPEHAARQGRATVLARKVSSVNIFKMLGLALILAGALGIAYGGFSYTKDTTAVKLGPLELTLKETQSVNVPLWAGVSAMVLGAALFVLGSKKT